MILIYINDRLMGKLPSAESVTVASLKELGHQIGSMTGRNWSVILQHVDGTFPNSAVQNSNV